MRILGSISNSILVEAYFTWDCLGDFYGNFDR